MDYLKLLVEVKHEDDGKEERCYGLLKYFYICNDETIGCFILGYGRMHGLRERGFGQGRQAFRHEDRGS